MLNASTNECEHACMCVVACNFCKCVRLRVRTLMYMKTIICSHPSYSKFKALRRQVQKCNRIKREHILADLTLNVGTGGAGWAGKTRFPHGSRLMVIPSYGQYPTLISQTKHVIHGGVIIQGKGLSLSHEPAGSTGTDDTRPPPAWRPIRCRRAMEAKWGPRPERVPIRAHELMSHMRNLLGWLRLGWLKVA